MSISVDQFFTKINVVEAAAIESTLFRSCSHGMCSAYTCFAFISVTFERTNSAQTTDRKRPQSQISVACCFVADD